MPVTRNKAAWAESRMIGKALKPARLAAGLTTKCVGAWMGVHRQSIYEWESGRRLVPGHMRKALMRMLGLRREAA